MNDSSLTNPLKTIILSLGFFLIYTKSQAQTYQLASPDFKTKINIENLGDFQIRIQHDDKPLVTAKVALELLDGRILAKDAKIKVANTLTQNEIISPVVAIKNAKIKNEYNELSIYFRDGYDIKIRAYNDAVAYRWILRLKDTVSIKNEISTWQINPKSKAYLQKIDDAVIGLNNYERPYDSQVIENLTAPTKSQLPLLIDNDEVKLIFTESDLFDYPGWYFEANKNGDLNAVFPKVVKNTFPIQKPNWGWDRTEKPNEREDYIAKILGQRELPWRIMAFAKTDKELLTNEIVYKLASNSVIGDSTWIKPGKVAWDWWSDWNLTGIDFKAGINNQTYQYYIDFASKYNLEYIVLDDGWYELGNLTKSVKDIDIEALVAYSKSKNVRILLWGSWKTLNQNMTEVMDIWQKWGVAGMKIDFMDRDDQAMVNFYERCASEAAKRKLIVDFHGAYKPAGLQRKYPNVLNFEGVAGLENNKWGGQAANPVMAVTIPFSRMFAGPLDYTPGAMLNAQKHEYAVINSKPMSLGTRCQQLAMYVVYEAPLQMLADNPSHYLKEPEAMNWLGAVPTVWDRTLALDAKIGEYVLMARQKNKDWFMGALTNWDERDLEIDFSFLEKGTYELEIWQDGTNANKNGSDFKYLKKNITSTEKLKIHLAKGGGWAGRIIAKK